MGDSELWAILDFVKVSYSRIIMRSGICEAICLDSFDFDATLWSFSNCGIIKTFPLVPARAVRDYKKRPFYRCLVVVE